MREKGHLEGGCRARPGSRAAPPPDRFEGERGAFFDAVRRAYRERAEAAPGRFEIVDAARPLEAVQADIRQRLLARLTRWNT